MRVLNLLPGLACFVDNRIELGREVGGQTPSSRNTQLKFEGHAHAERLGFKPLDAPLANSRFWRRTNRAVKSGTGEMRSLRRE